MAARGNGARERASQATFGCWGRRAITINECEPRTSGTLGSGTVDNAPVYPREIVKRALLLVASAVILVHNHPSGDTAPSRANIDITREVAKACATVGIALHDHLIVTRAGHSSLRALGLS